MKILLTGHKGFIGTHFKAKFSYGHDFYYLRNFDPNIGYKSAIVEDKDGLVVDDVAELGLDVCVNLAWSGLGDYSWKTLQRNYLLHTSLAEYLSRLGVPRVVNIGSSWEYDRLGEACAETRSSVAQSRLSACKSGIRFYFDSMSAIENYWLRVFFVFGNGQRKESLIPSTLNSIKKNLDLVLRSPGDSLDFIYIDDVVAAIFEFCGTTVYEPGIYNIGTGKSTKCIEVVEKLKEISGQPLNIETPNGLNFYNQRFWADPTKVSSMKWFKDVTSLDAALASLFENLNCNV